MWSLRSLGFTADPVTTPLNNAAGPDPLLNYDVLYATSNWPTNTTARARLTAFFARGGGLVGSGFVIGAHVTNQGVANAGFLANSGQVTGLSSAFRNVNTESGIIRWSNTGGSSSLITGAYPALDTASVDPPAWYTAVPSGWAVDANLPLSGFFAAGLWQVGATPSAAGAPIVAHGLNTAGTSRMTVFGFNPFYKGDPEREWPAFASAALWADQ